MLLPAAFALVVAAAGWYYAFYSTAAQRLSGVESAANNRLRVRLRRINGCLMIGLGATVYLFAASFEQKWNVRWVALLVLAMLGLVLSVSALALADVWLTRRLRSDLRARRRRDAPAAPPRPADDKDETAP